MILHFKWTVSRGRDTYGYNICTLYVDGVKTAKCNGGGYDLQGTVLGEFIQNKYQTELMKIKKKAGGKLIVETEGKWSNPSSEGELYGMKYVIDQKRKTETIQLDGACGFDSMRKIIKALNLELTYMQKMSERNGKPLTNDSYYSLSEK